MSKVVEKAQGVFLWVCIVVDNLVIGLEGSTDTQLNETLDLLPEELEKLYQRLFDQMPKNYINEVRQYLSLIYLKFLTGLLDFYLAIQDPVEVFTQENQSSREAI